MLTAAQTEALKASLSSSRVKSRKQAGRDLSYIEGWWAISEANRIFGFDAWNRYTTELKQLGDPREVDGKWRIAYMAQVRIEVMTGGDGPRVTIREGTGYGSGIDRDLGQAHESAIKEAETDAMKRALMTFGNPFGLALYDKEQNGVANEQPSGPGVKTRNLMDPSQSIAEWALDYCAMQKTNIMNCVTVADVQEWSESQTDDLKELKKHAPALWSDLRQFKENRIGNINLGVAAE